MSIPQQPPQPTAEQDDAFEAAMQGMKDRLSTLLDAPPPPTPRAGPPSPRPVASTAGAGVSMWGPSAPRVTSPLSLLVEVADNAHRLQRTVETLLVEVTGEAPPVRSREVAKLPQALLPAVARLAHEIERVHAEIGQVVSQLRARL